MHDPRLTLPGRLHATGCIDGVPKQTVAWHREPHHPGHHRPTVYSYPTLQAAVGSVSYLKRGNPGEDAQGHIGDLGCVIRVF